MRSVVAALAWLAIPPAWAQTQPDTPAKPPAASPGPIAASADWAACSALTQDRDARLACFDSWAQARRITTNPALASQLPVSAVAAQSAASDPAASAAAIAGATAGQSLAQSRQDAIDSGCKDTTQPRVLRQFDLRADTGCPSLTLRGWRPTSLALVGSTSVNTAPSSPSAGHTAAYTPYQRNETRIQVSVRTKIASGLLAQGNDRDSLWFGYTAQSYWQFFNGAISRPFRNTDHEPEFIYIYPLQTSSAPGWHWRYAGLGATHQSNGQTLPLSRSWNRSYAMTTLEKTVPTSSGNASRTQFAITGKAWQRWNESAANDDNPGISDYVGRAELQAQWYPDKEQQNIVGLTLRHSLRGTARGSARLEWLNRLDSAPKSGMYSHLSLFTGYGDSLVDYNRRRTVLTLGLSLLDW